MNADRSKTTTKILAILLVLAMIMVARESAQFVSTLEEHARRTFQKMGRRLQLWWTPDMEGLIQERLV